MPKRPNDVFISYARADQAIADRLDRTLRHDGYATWIDRRRLRGGQVWERELQGAIDDSRALVLLLSPAAVASLNVQAEYNYALDEGIKVVAVVIEPCVVPERLDASEHVSIVAPPMIPANVEETLTKVGIRPTQRATVRRTRLARNSSILGALAVLVALVVGVSNLLNAKTPLPLYQAPGAVQNNGVTSLVAGPDNAMWYLVGGGEGKPAIGRMTQDGHVTEYRLPGTDPRPNQLVVGPDGHLWCILSELENDQLVQVTPQGQFSEFGTASLGEPSSEIFSALTVGADGNLWLLETNKPAFLVVAPSGRLVRKVAINLNTFEVSGAMVRGRTGDFWVGGAAITSSGTVTSDNAIFRISPSGAAQTITRSDGLAPNGIVAATDGGVWVGYIRGDRFTNSMHLVHLGPMGATVKEMDVPQPNGKDIYPNLPPMVLGPDGALWFSQSDDYNQPFDLMRYDIAHDTFTRVIAPQSEMGIYAPDLLAAGPDGRLWGAGIHDDRTYRYFVQPLLFSVAAAHTDLRIGMG